MKAKLYALFLSAAPFSAFAQPTVNTAEDYTIGMTVRYKQVNNAAAGPSGSQTWNFSTLTGIGGSDTTIMTYLAAGSTYPGANILERSSAKQDHYYTESGTTNHTVAIVDSASAPTPITLSYSGNTALSMQRPLTYNLNVTDTFLSNLKYSTFTFNGGGTRNLSVDGYGTLILPGNKTYNDVLRVKTVHTQKDSATIGPNTIYVNVVITSYSWFNAMHKSPILRMDSFSLSGTPPVPTIATPTTSYLIDETYPGNVPDVTQGNSIAANLSGQTLMLNGNMSSKQHEVLLYNMSGQMLFRSEFVPQGNAHSFTVAADLPAGMYFVLVAEKNNPATPAIIKIVKE